MHAMPYRLWFAMCCDARGLDARSHKEVEQRRREKAKQYFDELRVRSQRGCPADMRLRSPRLMMVPFQTQGLLPYGGDSAKFDKNAILHHSIELIKSLLDQLRMEDANGAKVWCALTSNRHPCVGGCCGRLSAKRMHGLRPGVSVAGSVRG